MLRIVKGISVALVVSLVSAALLVRLLVIDGPSLRSLSLTWSSSTPPLRASMAPTPPLVLQDDQPSNSTHSSLPVAEGDEQNLLVAMVKEEEEFVEQSGMVRVWKHLVPVMRRKDLFPEARTKMGDASNAWGQLVEQLKKEQRNESAGEGDKVQCPYSVALVNSSHMRDGVWLDIPCGLVVDSSVTLVGVPLGSVGDDFRIDFLGHKVPGDTSPPVILHHNVRLLGDQLSPRLPVIVENTWTPSTDWEDEQRCPPPLSNVNLNKTVDGLVLCAPQVGKEVSSGDSSVRWPGGHGGGSMSKRRTRQPWFPYAHGHPFAATLWVGWDGFHVTVDGKHVTSFEYRQNLEPWMVNGVRIAGALELSSVIVNGLPTSESHESVGHDLDVLKAPPLLEPVDLFIGVVSTANNFERRMAVRRSWMQYEGVRSGQVAVRFFVGLHQNQQVNVELWNEGLTYGDIQLLPFVDYYNLITLKTLAISIFATKVVKSHYVMKTDDDTFVRVDKVLSFVRETNRSQSLLYGLIESDSKPDRDVHSKWYVTPEEWLLPSYPPWAHGPGYIFSNDIAHFVAKMNDECKLKLFKLEDVAMGAWIEEYSRLENRKINYANDATFHSDGCKTGYTIAHYQNPRQMVCLWQQLRQGSGPVCC